MEARRIERRAIGGYASCRFSASASCKWEWSSIVSGEPACDVLFHARYSTLIEQVLDRRLEAERLAFADLIALLEVEVGLDVPRCSLCRRRAQGNQSGRRILRRRDELASISYIHRKPATRQAACKPVAQIQVGGFRRALIQHLEDAEVAHKTMSPAQGVIGVALERVRPIRWQQPARRSTVIVPREHRFIERAAVVR